MDMEDRDILMGIPTKVFSKTTYLMAREPIIGQTGVFLKGTFSMEPGKDLARLRSIIASFIEGTSFEIDQRESVKYS